MKASIHFTRKGLVFLSMLASAAGAADLTTFGTGMPARAADVNGNFQELARRLDSLSKVVLEQSNLLDSLSLLRGKMHSDSMALSAGVLLPGAVAGFLVPPDPDGFLPNSAQTWVLAADQKAVNGIALPDLRGQFLRGLDVMYKGKVAGTDPETDRKPGSLQTWMLGSHSHQAATTTNWSGSSGPPSPLVSGLQLNNGLSLGSIQTGAFGGQETRPRNAAVYWYVKVK